MKDYLKQLLSNQQNDLMKRSVVREYLQARMLQALQDSGAYLNWVFHGGTALRFLYLIPRYSEDLDFSVLDTTQGPDFKDTLKAVKTKFEAEGYELNVKLNDRKVVHSAFLRFQGLLYELDLSAHPSENLSIKLEVDTNPPMGAVWETSLIRRYVTVNLPHHDKASLLAGKLHAVLSRGYVKGRDLYDLVWYLSDRSWPEPNLQLLINALTQTQWKGSMPTPKNWKTMLLKHLATINWKLANEDVAPFLEQASDLQLLTYENCRSLLDT